MTKTKIEWADRVWNPVTGCTKVSQGCKNCYAERIAKRFWGERKFSDVQIHPERLGEPLKWRKPSKIFVNSMSDLFHEKVPFEFIKKVWDMTVRRLDHTFQVLTKRPARMFEFTQWMAGNDDIGIAEWPRNVWLGVSVENQATADERIPLLLQTPAAVRFVSYEPALGAVDFGDNMSRYREIGTELLPILDWIIMGGESGPGARPMHPAWARSVRDQCQEAGTPFFFKQWGEWLPVASPHMEYKGERIVMSSSGEVFRNAEWSDVLGTEGYMWGFERVGKHAAGRLLDGRTWDEFPAQG